MGSHAAFHPRPVFADCLSLTQAGDRPNSSSPPELCVCVCVCVGVVVLVIKELVKGLPTIWGSKISKQPWGGLTKAISSPPCFMKCIHQN